MSIIRMGFDAPKLPRKLRKATTSRRWEKKFLKYLNAGMTNGVITGVRKPNAARS